MGLQRAVVEYQRADDDPVYVGLGAVRLTSGAWSLSAGIGGDRTDPAENRGCGVGDFGGVYGARHVNFLDGDYSTNFAA